nr:endonuclease/exonuclease/phosphatase family protein [Egibacter rhizosphaerae]
MGDDSVDFGLAVLSRWPIISARVWRLPIGGGVDLARIALGVDLQTPGGPLPVLTTHLSALRDGSWLRQRQVAVLGEALRTLDAGSRRSIVTGDLNATPDADEVRALTGGTSTPHVGMRFVDAWAQTRPAELGRTLDPANPHVSGDVPSGRIDYVLAAAGGAEARGRVRSTELVGVEPVDGVMASDHYGVLARLRC